MDVSVYLDDPAALRRTRQIVLSGTLENGAAKVKWAFKRG